MDNNQEKKDLLKDFVDQHRETFDHRAPDPAIRERIWQGMKLEQEKPVVKSLSSGLPLSSNRPADTKGSRGVSRLWSVAASVAVLIVIGAVAAFWLMDEVGSIHPENRQISKSILEPQQDQLVEVSKLNPLEAGLEQQSMDEEPSRLLRQNQDNQVRPDHSTLNRRENRIALEKQEAAENRIEALLETEESAIRRLEGVLEMASLPDLPQNLIDKLVYTVNSDPNSNVRSAAIELLMSRLPATQTGQAIQDVFITQDDPTIQLELMQAMVRHDSIRINEVTADRLNAIAADPLTLDFVKEQAYAVLLKTW